MPSLIPPFTGRCLCGSVRYRCTAAPLWQAHCHCDSCRRATSSGFTSFLGMADGAWHWTGALPRRYASSPGVSRWFCGTCGAQMAFRSATAPGEMHFYAATLDAPEAYAPTAHDFIEERLPWVHLADTPRRAGPDTDWTGTLALLHRAFAYMEGRIDPPSSLASLTPLVLSDLARKGEVWLIGAAPIACMVLTPQADALYLGKLAVDPAHRRAGMARMLVDLAVTRARGLGLPVVELQTRVELVENHATFRALGFSETARRAHPGFDRPTSVTFRRPVPGVVGAV